MFKHCFHKFLFLNLYALFYSISIRQIHQQYPQMLKEQNDLDIVSADTIVVKVNYFINSVFKIIYNLFYNILTSPSHQYH